MPLASEGSRAVDTRRGRRLGGCPSQSAPPRAPAVNGAPEHRLTTRNAASSILTVLGVVVALRLGRDFLMPVALAALLGFWLSPVVARLERWRLPCAGAVLPMTTLLGAVVVSGGWYAGRQLSALPENLPTYRANLLTKLQTIRRPLGALERVGRVFDEVEREISGAAPQAVVVERAGGLALATGLAAPLVAPMGTAAAVAILVLFSLLERDSLRDRMLAIVGGDDLAAATSAIDDATFRLSRYLGAQSLLCAAHGILVGAGLFALGVPTAWLFGLLAGLLRFVPYLGPWVAAALPVTVSIAAFPGWLPHAFVPTSARARCGRGGGHPARGGGAREPVPGLGRRRATGAAPNQRRARTRRRGRRQARGDARNLRSDPRRERRPARSASWTSRRGSRRHRQRGGAHAALARVPAGGERAAHRSGEPPGRRVRRLHQRAVGARLAGSDPLRGTSNGRSCCVSTSARQPRAAKLRLAVAGS